MNLQEIFELRGYIVAASQNDRLEKCQLFQESGEVGEHIPVRLLQETDKEDWIAQNTLLGFADPWPGEWKHYYRVVVE